MSLPTKADSEILELMVDRVSLYEVLSMLEAICTEKADHIEITYGDKDLAAMWMKAGSDICEASSGTVAKL